VRRSAPETIFVCTEASSHLDQTRRVEYERIRSRLADLAGATCSLVHYSEVRALDGAGAVVLSGSDAPWEAHPPDAFAGLARALAATDAPVLGICAGMQLLTWFHGGAVEPMASPGPRFEVGFHPVRLHAPDDPLLEGLGAQAEFYENHSYEVTELPAGFEPIARGARCRYEGFRRRGAPVWGVQFHPEAADEAHPAGERLLRNFFAQAQATR
jgi:GMP synthase-like glutamine amidotransferase